MKRRAYAKAGVDVEQSNHLKASLPKLIRSTYRPEMIGEIGAFGALFRLDKKHYRQPVLVSSVDGVGTKLRVAFEMNHHHTIGEDLVNHCVNDIAVLGAEPLFFLDYFSTSTLEPQIFEAIIKGIAKACRENHCALVGGETSQMPGFYRSGEYDMSGTIIGVVEQSQIIDGRHIQPNDVILGLPSNGLHTNGFTLARKVFFEQLGLKPDSQMPDCEISLGKELLKVHRSYLVPMRKMLKHFNDNRRQPIVKGFAHITGGGFVGNLPRILPADVDAQIRIGSWHSQPVFELIEKAGKISKSEMHAVFNMGIGMIAVIDENSKTAVIDYLKSIDEECFEIGFITKGNGGCELQMQ